jgi:hypothetical protein
MARSNVSGKILLELLGLDTGRQPTGPKSFDDRTNLLFVDLRNVKRYKLCRPRLLCRAFMTHRFYSSDQLRKEELDVLSGFARDKCAMFRSRL